MALELNNSKLTLTFFKIDTISEPSFIIKQNSITQLGVVDRIKEIHVYSFNKVSLITEKNQYVDVQSSLLDLPRVDNNQLKHYLENAFLVVNQLSDGAFRVSSKLRLAGGGKNTKLHKAIKKYDLKAAMKAINEDVLKKRKYTIDALDDKYNTPLLLACELGFIAAIELLIAHNANINYCSRHSYVTPLAVACAAGNLAIIEFLITNGARVNPVEAYSLPPLLIACQQKVDKTILELLIKHGADVNAKTSTNRTAFSEACRIGFYEGVSCLISMVDDINHVDNCGNTPLHIACTYSTNSLVIELLLKFGADPNKRNNKGLTPLHAAYINKASALFLASLIPHTKDFETFDSNGRTILYAACVAGEEEVTKLLLQYGANPNAPIKISPHNTPLIGVCHPLGCRNVSMINLLLAAGADINYLNSSKHNALHFACDATNASKTVRLDVVERLVDAGINMYQISSEGLTPLQMAKSHNVTKTVAYLSSNPRPNPQNNNAMPTLVKYVASDIIKSLAEQIATRALRLVIADSIKLPVDIIRTIKEAVIEQLTTNSAIFSGISGENDNEVALRMELSEKIKQELKLCLCDDSVFEASSGKLNLSEIKIAVKQAVATWSAARANTLAAQRQTDQLLLFASSSYGGSAAAAAAAMPASSYSTSSNSLENMQKASEIANNVTSAVSNIVGLFQ